MGIEILGIEIASHGGGGDGDGEGEVWVEVCEMAS